MDTSAYLRKQGWRGTGHSLDHTDRGIKRPLLVSKKIDVLGLGLNKHAAVNDQWWLRAFDAGLKDFGTGKTSLLGSVQKHGHNRGGLYGRFVQGDGVPGTLGQSSLESTPIGSITPVDIEDAPRIGGVGSVPEQDAASTTEMTGDKKRKRVGGLSETRKKQKGSTSELAKSRKGSATSGAESISSAKKKPDAKRAAESELTNGESPLQETKAERRARRELKSEQKIQKKAAKDRAKEAKTQARLARTVSKDKHSAADARNLKDDTQGLNPKKMAMYTQRAAAKGVSLEDYIRRREEKSAAKKAEKSELLIPAEDG